LSPVPSPADSRLYLVTAARPDLEPFLVAAMATLEKAREVTRRLGVPLVVNDRPDLALLCDADFVHLGQDDLPVDAARKLGLRVGQSTHATAEIEAADADYIGVGPVYATPTKEGRPAVGLELVRYAVEHARQPWFAIGGIDESNVRDVVGAGARRVAVVRAIGDAADPEAAAARLRSALS
jgi:thiamine-phosphate pyrophosphorylase